jgi:hypothetical protein
MATSRSSISKSWRTGPIAVIDVSSAADPWAAAEAWMWEDMLRPVDLRQGPLFTQAVFKAAWNRFFWYKFGECTVIRRNLSNGQLDGAAIVIYDRSADGGVQAGIQIAFDTNPGCYGPESSADIARRFSSVLAVAKGRFAGRSCRWSGHHRCDANHRAGRDPGQARGSVRRTRRWSPARLQFGPSASLR